MWNLRHISFPYIVQQLFFRNGGEFWAGREPFLDENAANDKAKPTLVTRGLFNGYSMPIWDAGGNVNEELHFRLRVPHRWNGTTAPSFYSISAISAGETENDRYQFELAWCAEDVENVVPDTICETLTCECICSTGKNAAWFAQIIAFELDPATLVSGQNMQMRLRRIAATASDVTNEIVLFHWDTRWKMNNIGSTSASGY